MHLDALRGLSLWCCTGCWLVWAAGQACISSWILQLWCCAAASSQMEQTSSRVLTAGGCFTCHLHSAPNGLGTRTSICQLHSQDASSLVHTFSEKASIQRFRSLRGGHLAAPLPRPSQRDGLGQQAFLYLICRCTSSHFMCRGGSDGSLST